MTIKHETEDIGQHDWAFLTLSADQSTNISANNHIELDTIRRSSSAISLSTGTGQQNGIITLPANKTFKVIGGSRGGYSSLDSSWAIQVYNITNTAYEGSVASMLPTSRDNVNIDNGPGLIAVVRTTVETTISINFKSIDKLINVYAINTRFYIEQIKDEEV